MLEPRLNINTRMPSYSAAQRLEALEHLYYIITFYCDARSEVLPG
ncbi:hypothetical protein C1752_04309 [Acaryochloris thomasi RCC1774]|uniref:Uncharacterized protein n=1 Tax=Acaryochloris thomasi RCC1774 TaxID=1764569 RepID=A0A2W1JSM5_9CYAN|nr:hypothetical protein C1752_04309 [Acaryochloris thomasi RCC1774]